MSYVRRYEDTIVREGTKTVRYPASEHGGIKTVHYREVIPIGINILVDTDPYDASLEGTNDSVKLMLGAVTAAQAAQIAEIEHSAEKITQATVRGFYGMLASEMSTQTQELSSSMSSIAGLLAEQAHQVDVVRQQLDDDYHAIKARYLSIFTNLDAELERRVRELDRPMFQMGVHAMRDVVEKPYEASAASAVVQTGDLGATQLKLQCARTKSIVSGSLATLGDMCSYIQGYEQSAEDVMEKNGAELAEGDIYLPVVYTIQQSIEEDVQCIQIHGGEHAETPEIRKGVMTKVARGSGTERSEIVPEDKEQIDREFMKYLERYRSGQIDGATDENRERVCQQIMNMYQATPVTTEYANDGNGAASVVR